MAMLAIPLPSGVSRLFQDIEVDGERDNSDHITMFYFGDNLSIKKVVQIIPVLYDILTEITPFSVKTNKIVSFPKGQDGYPVIAKLKSPGIHSLREKLLKEFKNKNIDFEDKFPTYNPHVTLSYSKKKPKPIKIEPCEWQVNEVSLYCGDVGDTKMFVNFPLGVQLKESSVKASLYSKAFKMLTENNE